MEITSLIYVVNEKCEAVIGEVNLSSQADSIPDCLLGLGILSQFSPDGLSLLLQHLDVILPTLSRVVIFGLYCLLLWWVYDATPRFY